MEKKNDGVNYSDILSRATKEDPAIRENLESDREGVDYSTEFRKQTGKDLETGEIAVQ